LLLEDSRHNNSRRSERSVSADASYLHIMCARGEAGQQWAGGDSAGSLGLGPGM
jgi:hypothetical protein